MDIINKFLNAIGHEEHVKKPLYEDYLIPEKHIPEVLNLYTMRAKYVLHR